MRWHRRPAEVEALLQPKQRALAWSQLDPQGWAVATVEGITVAEHETTERLPDDRQWMSGPGGGSGDGEGVRSLPWVQVLGAAWDDPILELRIWAPQESTVLRLNLREGRTFPQVVRERIMQSLLVQVHVPFVGDKGVRFLARRDPVTDEVFWQRVVDLGLDISQPALAAAVENAQLDLSLTYGV